MSAAEKCKKKHWLEIWIILSDIWLRGDVLIGRLKLVNLLQSFLFVYQVIDILSAAKFITPELGELPPALKARLGDSNKNLVSLQKKKNSALLVKWYPYCDIEALRLEQSHCSGDFA